MLIQVLYILIIVFIQVAHVVHEFITLYTCSGDINNKISNIVTHDYLSSYSRGTMLKSMGVVCQDHSAMLLFRYDFFVIYSHGLGNRSIFRAER